MKTMVLLQKLLLPILSTILFFPAQAQNHNSKSVSHHTKNVSVYGNFGYYVVYGTVSLNVEAKVWSRNRDLGRSIWVKAYASRWYGALGYEDGGPAYLVGGVYLAGRSEHFFEAMLGATYIYNKISYNNLKGEYDYERVHNPDVPPPFSEPLKSDYIYFLPAGSAGYRYQPINGNFLFRAGFGFPDALYVSIGFSI